MIKKTTLKNFKCFQHETEFELGRINLLTGINGRGKSSLLQSILLLSQSIEDKNSFCKIEFNGSSVNLGNYRDIQNRNTSNNLPIEISHLTEKGKISLILERDENDDTIGNIANDFDKNILNDFQKIHYIAADRIGPQEFYLKSTLPRFITVGTKGEHIGNVLYQKRELLVNEIFQSINSNSSNELLIKIGEWLSFVLNTDNISIYTENPDNTRIITLTFGVGGSKFRPQNIGFGYSYVLPIVTSSLIANKGDILIIENPEAHLHPKAQSNLMYFLSLVAKSGIQIFIESHSEHILNSLRVLVKKEIIEPELTNIFFFNDKADKLYSKIDIKEKGAIDLWPENFFDQNELDLKELIGF